MKTKHRLGKRMAVLITVMCMIFTMLPINALAFNPDWYKTHITSVSIGTPTTDLNGKKYLPVTVNFSAEEDISDSNAVYFLEGYLLATLKNGQKAEGIEGNGMTLIGPLKPDALDGMGSNAYSWNWKGWEEGGGEGVLKYNIPLLEDGDTQTVEQSPATGQPEVNGLKVGDEVSFKIETVMNTETIPDDILPPGGSLMSDEFKVMIEDSSNYPKTITTSEGECKHDGELAYINNGSKGHDIKCKKCNEIIGSESHSFSSWTVTKKATCTATGVQTRKCTVCGATETKTIAKTAHTYKKYTTKATLTKNGSIVEKCSVCGTKKSTTTIYYPKTFTLAKTSYVYNGKVQKPAVTVKDAKGKVIAKSNYTVTYSSGCKNVGKYAVKVTFKGNYSRARMLYYTIIPKGTSISKLTARKKAFTAKWAKNATQTTGYQIQYTTDRKFKIGVKTVTMNKNTTVSKAISKLTGGKKYYVRVRTYRNANKVNYFSAWSGAKAVTTKK